MWGRNKNVVLLLVTALHLVYLVTKWQPTETSYQRVPTTYKAEIVIYTMYHRSRNVVKVFSCSHIADKRSFFKISDFPVKVFSGLTANDKLIRCACS